MLDHITSQWAVHEEMTGQQQFSVQFSLTIPEMDQGSILAKAFFRENTFYTGIEGSA